MKLPLFTTIVITFAFIWFYMKNSTRKMKEEEEKFWEKEIKANSVRKQPLTDLDYIKIPFEELALETLSESLSDSDSEESPANPVIAECTQKILGLKRKRIVNLNGISNTDLKLKYGVSNLTVLSEYDENYTILVSALADLAEELYKLSLSEDELMRRYPEVDLSAESSIETDEAKRLEYRKAAVRILECAVKCGSDVKRSYALLSDIYVEDKNYDRIEELIEIASASGSSYKDGIVAELKKRSIFTPNY